MDIITISLVTLLPVVRDSSLSPWDLGQGFPSVLIPYLLISQNICDNLVRFCCIEDNTFFSFQINHIVRAEYSVLFWRLYINLVFQEIALTLSLKL